ncbi:MAG: glucokinase [Desulfobacterales bacterium]
MKTILAADIGGTNSRFAAFRTGEGRVLELMRSLWLNTAEFDSMKKMLDQLEKENFDLPASAADVSVMAVAGPIVNKTYSNPPNIDWDIDLSELTGAVGLKKCALINDFVAQAFACRSPVMDVARRVLAGTVDPAAPLAVIGAGTGLGQATLVPLENGGYTALASEGGHTSFPFESAAEVKYMHYLLQDSGEPYVRAETVVSGGGLSRLHHFLTGERLEPAEVAGSLTDESATLRWMARFLGRLSRNYALTVVAFGGVYISGGVAAKLPELVTHREFARAFRKTEVMSHVLDRIPVFLNTDEESGLWGAAMKGMQILQGD